MINFNNINSIKDIPFGYRELNLNEKLNYKTDIIIYTNKNSWRNNNKFEPVNIDGWHGSLYNEFKGNNHYKNVVMIIRKLNIDRKESLVPKWEVA
jgi:hypothetical protein